MINIDKVVKDIKSIKIQGATNIEKASISALLDFIKDFKVGVLPKIENCKICNFLRVSENNANKLSFARPDASLNQNLVNYIMMKLEKNKNKFSDFGIKFFLFTHKKTYDSISMNKLQISNCKSQTKGK